jgi:hypothetical protein
MRFTTTCLLVASLMLPVAGGCGSGDSEKDAAVKPDSLVQVNFSHDNLIEACVRLAACNVDRKPRVSDCIENFHKRFTYFGQRKLYEALYHCANQGNGDCKVIRECLGYKGRPQNGECDKAFAAKCEDDVAHTCDLIVGGWLQALDCKKGGLKCAVRDTGSTKTAVCTIDSCNKDLFKPECRDRKLLTCVGGAIQIDDCPAKQLQCRDPNVGLCEGTGRSCSQTSPTCKGSVVVTCEQSYLSEIDCSKVYGKKKCDPLSVSCVGAGTQCDTGGQTTFDTCEADTLVVCIDGTLKRFDCKKMGFVGCEKAAYGAYCKAEHVYD